MKVLYYIHFLAIGGAEKIVVDYLLNLKKSNIDVVLVVLHCCGTFLEKRIIDAGIKIYPLNQPCFIQKFNGAVIRINRLMGYEKKWKKILSKEKPDLIHAHTHIDTLKNIGFPASKMIFTFHAQVGRSLRLSSDLNKCLLEKFASEGMSFFALTDQACIDISAIYPNSKIFKIPNAIDIEQIKGAEISRTDFLKKNDIPNDAFILGNVGRFHPVKNHEKIIAVFEEVHRMNGNAYLLLIGGDNDNRMDLIQNMVKEKGLVQFVRFLGIREDAISIMSLFDVFILPSLSESFSLATIEAQVLGKRCVVSDNVPEEVCCNDNCFRLELNKSDKEWAELILSDSTKYRNRDVSRYDIHCIISQMIDVYSKICED